MPTYDLDTETKIIALKGLYNLGTTIKVHEMIKVEWSSDPDDAVYYSRGVIQTASVAPVDADDNPIVVDVRLIEGDDDNWFVPVKTDSTIGDEEIDLELWDADGDISDKLVDFGEGGKVTLLYWFPQVELLLPWWNGHLEIGDGGDGITIKIKAAQGYRSSEEDLPDRGHVQYCQAMFGGLLETLGLVAANDCPYNKHLGGSTGNLNPATSEPWTFCDRLTTQSCIDRGIDPLYHLSHRTIEATISNNQSKGPRLNETSHGNETNLAEPVRVVMGQRRLYGMPIIAFRRDHDTRDPDHGFFQGVYEGCEGPISGFFNTVVTVENSSQNVDFFHYSERLGEIGQAPAMPDLTPHGYSGTSHFRYTFGWVNPDNVDPGNCKADSTVSGLRNIRVYTDADTYTETFTRNRVWHLARMLCDKRWGAGWSYDDLDIPLWIEAAEWCDESVIYTDPFGKEWPHIRSLSDVELVGRKMQQQVEDLCIAGRLSLPFIFNGKLCIIPLKALDSGELDDAPIFTDVLGDDCNIIYEGDPKQSTLHISQKSVFDLKNQIKISIDDINQNWFETPLRPFEDIDAQLAAGRARGTHSRKINTEEYKLLGVCEEAQGTKIGWSILDLGPLDRGGLANNLSISFKIWFPEALALHPFKVIKVVSPRLVRYGFQYFRVMDMDRNGDLEYTITAQAYNETYMDAFETDTDPVDPTSPPGPEDPTCILLFGEITYQDGVLNIPIQPC